MCDQKFLAGVIASIVLVGGCAGSSVPDDAMPESTEAQASSTTAIEVSVTSVVKPTTTAAEVVELVAPVVLEFPDTIAEFVTRWNAQVADLELAQLELAPENEALILDVTDALRLGEPFEKTFDDGSAALRSDGVADTLFVQFIEPAGDGSFESVQLFVNPIVLGSSGLPSQVPSLARIMFVAAIHGDDHPSTVLTSLSDTQRELGDANELVSVVYNGVEWEAAGGILLTAALTDVPDTIDYIQPEPSSIGTAAADQPTDSASAESGGTQDGQHYWKSCTSEGFGDDRVFTTDFEAGRLSRESDDFKDIYCAHLQALPDGVLANPLALTMLEEFARGYEEGSLGLAELPYAWELMFPSATMSFDEVEFFQN